jgi:hypothetical protein
VRSSGRRQDETTAAITEGHAQWTMLGDADIQLSFHSGEGFLLAERVIIRLA